MDVGENTVEDKIKSKKLKKVGPAVKNEPKIKEPKKGVKTKRKSAGKKSQKV